MPALYCVTRDEFRTCALNAVFHATGIELHFNGGVRTVQAGTWRAVVNTVVNLPGP